jgi:hypothetical protein
MIVGSLSNGGLAALAVKISGRKNNTREVTSDSNERSISNVNPD